MGDWFERWLAGSVCGCEGDGMKKVAMEEYTMFAMSYASGEHSNERFGQAFMNTFYTGRGITDPDLFYTRDRDEAVEIIFDKYINLGVVS
jgi:hypothetical protein